jgi:hypothetical protein
LIPVKFQHSPPCLFEPVSNIIKTLNDLTIKGEKLKSGFHSSNFGQACEDALALHRIIESLQKSLQFSEVSEIEEAVSKCLQRDVELRQFLGADDIIAEARALADARTLLERVQIAVGCSRFEEVLDAVERIVKIIQALRRIFGADCESDLVSMAKDLQLKGETLRRILNRVLFVLSGKDAFRVELGISQEAEDRLLQTMDTFKRNADAARDAIEVILGRARLLQYMDRDVLDAVDWIVKVKVDEEKQMGIERIHQEVSTLRVTYEKVREKQEAHNEKLKKRLESQSTLLLQVQEKAAEKEDELKGDSGKAQEKARLSQNGYEREKRIREELMRVIQGQVCDTEFLRGQVGILEMKAVEVAEKIMGREKSSFVF